jgi:hypothetical protein
VRARGKGIRMRQHEESFEEFVKLRARLLWGNRSRLAVKDIAGDATRAVEDKRWQHGQPERIVRDLAFVHSVCGCGG